MLRRLVRSYFRLRYFPRHIFAAFTGLSDAIADLHRHEQEVIERLMSAHEERLARIHEEIAGFCDDAIRAMMAESASIASIDTRIQALQHGLQRLESGTIDAQGRLAALQKSSEPANGHAGPRADDPGAIAALTELVRHQAAQMDHLKALVMQQSRLPPAPANTAVAPEAADQMAGDDGRLSRA